MLDAGASTQDALEVADLACVRGDRLIFEALEFTLAAGDILQLVGSNGSGKTSLLRILCGLAAPAAGNVRWRGLDVHQHPLLWRENLCVMGHLSGVSGSLTARENLAVTLALSANAPRCGIEAALATVGLTKQLDTPAAHLSAGQRQRIALARLALTTAPVWLLDEPLTALDLDGKEIVAQLLRTHAEHGGLAVLATHQPLDSADLKVSSFQLPARAP
jgi:heme exporter protein A